MPPRFKDQDPNFPERTKLGAGLSDRTNERSMDEVRDYLKKITKLLSGLDRKFITDGIGNRWDFLGRLSGPALPNYGLAVVRVSSTEVKVLPSVVSGMGAWATVPQIGGTSLASTPSPTLSVNSDRWVALYLEVDPEPEVLYAARSEAESDIYGVAEGAGVLVGDIDVRSYLDEAAMSEASQPAQINASTGAAQATGQYVIPLSWRNDDGVWRQVGYSGPLGVRMCRSGAFIALSPARGPGVEVVEEEAP